MPTILLVEDDDMSRDILVTRLTRNGYAVTAVSNGEEALASVEAAKPDLIVLDMNMPVLAGWETAKRLKASPGTRAIPILALTAHALAGDRQKALNAGCDDYDTKPVQMPRVLEKIAALLAGKG